MIGADPALMRFRQLAMDALFVWQRARVPTSFVQESTIDDLELELLSEETAVVAAGATSPWVRGW